MYMWFTIPFICTCGSLYHLLVYDGFMDDSFGDIEREYLRKRTHHDEGEQDSIEDSDVCFELTSDSEIELTTEVSQMTVT